MKAKKYLALAVCIISMSATSLCSFAADPQVPTDLEDSTSGKITKDEEDDKIEDSMGTFEYKDENNNSLVKVSIESIKKWALEYFKILNENDQILQENIKEKADADDIQDQINSLESQIVENEYDFRYDEATETLYITPGEKTISLGNNGLILVSSNAITHTVECTTADYDTIKAALSSLSSDPSARVWRSKNLNEFICEGCTPIDKDTHADDCSGGTIKQRCIIQVHLSTTEDNVTIDGLDDRLVFKKVKQ